MIRHLFFLLALCGIGYLGHDAWVTSEEWVDYLLIIIEVSAAGFVLHRMFYHEI